jgi:ATP-dependent DNA ligase
MRSQSHTRLDASRVQILTRRGNDWTDKYPGIAKAIADLPAQNAYIDGELCGVLPDGRTAFNLIQNASDTGQGSLVFFLFDLLFLDGCLDRRGASIGPRYCFRGHDGNVRGRL